MRLVVVMALVGAGLLGGCGREDSTPEGAIKAFMTAVASLDSPKAYALLAPATRKDLQTLAEQANRHTGGRQQLKPEEMFLLGLVQVRHDVSNVEVISQDEGEARVRLTSGDKEPVTEELTLKKEEGAWRILLKLPKPSI